ncbi:HAD family hydrolase [Candidatus Daviesbacteria bacterium]|nr:HAD family hydrolase [Candidatus Daviesbacteria bacterium]
MLNIFRKIKAVGFDLDRTLYKENPQVANKIKVSLVNKVLNKKPELKSFKEAEEFYDKLYMAIGSNTQTLRKIGFVNAEQIMYECLSNADISEFLSHDDRLCKLFSKLQKKYWLFLISTKPSDLAKKALIKLGLSPDIFKFCIHGDNPQAKTKTDGLMFKYLLKLSKLVPGKHVYIGDSLKADILPAKNLGILTIAVGDINEANAKISNIYEIENLLL